MSKANKNLQKKKKNASRNYINLQNIIDAEQ